MRIAFPNNPHLVSSLANPFPFPWSRLMAEEDPDSVVSLQDVLEENQQLEDTANAVLGDSDDTQCTYQKVHYLYMYMFSTRYHVCRGMYIAKPFTHVTHVHQTVIHQLVCVWPVVYTVMMDTHYTNCTLRGDYMRTTCIYLNMATNQQP